MNRKNRRSNTGASRILSRMTAFAAAFARTCKKPLAVMLLELIVISMI